MEGGSKVFFPLSLNGFLWIMISQEFPHHQCFSKKLTIFKADLFICHEMAD